ncbi:MAG: hypothetical protein WD512_06385 [Candidatus Paceibacterota bacterium]
MKKYKFKIDQGSNDKETTIYLNDEEIAHADYDENGWDGMHLIENITEKIGRILDIDVEYV